MGSYRLEEASTGRAGCQNKECKDTKTKIAKGELRFGTWVDTERIQAFMWRHWGCVTPKLIGNLNETIDEEGGGGDEKDYTAIDGYEDLPDELQEKVRGALEQGHVDDEDWKGDVEMNRPGKTGFRVRKKAGAAAKKDDEEKEPPKTKKRGKAQDNEDEEEPEKPAKKTKKDARGTKKAAKEEPESDTAEEEPEKEEEKPARKSRGRAAKTASANRKKQDDAAEEGKDEEMADAEEPAEEKPKRGGRKKRAT
ncbi:hypothetical protein SI65_09626 [Aspergillus cristatus]|uniref:PARP-type domain-containing protein n=1 Tax=Aspergillus cristatus TaxID=573508 RepID=A0A1E3B1T5_ASPCR|nr:hypothetical protein SI65_09626 [Aspergillus cristatus]